MYMKFLLELHFLSQSYLPPNGLHIINCFARIAYHASWYINIRQKTFNGMVSVSAKNIIFKSKIYGPSKQRNTIIYNALGIHISIYYIYVLQEKCTDTLFRQTCINIYVLTAIEREEKNACFRTRVQRLMKSARQD